MSIMTRTPRVRCPRALLLFAAAITTVSLAAPALAQRDWGEGDFYTFATDDAGWSVVEPGQTHRRIYVSASGRAGNTGLSEDSPVDLNTGMNMVRAGSSDWLLLKRGDDFGDATMRLRSRFTGESALHPIVLGAYGAGDRPVLGGPIILWDDVSNLVIRDLHFVRRPANAGRNAFDILGNVSNLLIENIRSDGRESRMHTTSSSEIHHVTLRRNVMVDATEADLEDSPHRDRISSWYISGASHVLIEQNVFDHNAWDEGYQSDPTHRELQEPSMFSHNLYVGPGMHDMTLRDNFTTRGASMGFKLVSPGVIEGNVFVANNLAAGINDGDQGDTDEGGGDFLVFRDNVSLHGADKRGSMIGARGWGFTFGEDDTADNAVIQRNVEAHTTAVGGGNTLATQEVDNARVFADNVVHDWRNEPNLDPDSSQPYPDASRTIASYMASIGEPATLDAFYEAIRSLQRGEWDSDVQASEVVRYIQEGFGVFEGGRDTPTTVAFASAGTDGVRWDNRANWSTNDRPVAGDRVQLAGHTVNFSSVVSVESIDLGGGTLRVRGGLLEVTTPGGVTGGGDVEIARSGQFIVDGQSDAEHLGLHLVEGRLRNTGMLGGAFTLAVSGGAAELLGGDDQAGVEVRSGSRVLILGGGARIGGYGDTAGQIRMYDGGRFDFVFDADGVSTVRALDGSTGVFTFHADADGLAGTVLGIDVSGLLLSSGLHEFRLIDADALHGEFGVFQVTGLGENGVTGVRLIWDQSAGDAILTVAVHDARIDGFEYQAVLVPEPSTALGVLGAGAAFAGRAARQSIPVKGN